MATSASNWQDVPPPEHGFLHKGCIVYALRYQIEPPPELGGISEIIVWPDRAGNNSAKFDGAAQPYIAPAEPGKPIPVPRKIVTMKPGEELVIRGQRHKILKVEIFSASAPLTQEGLAWWHSGDVDRGQIGPPYGAAT